MSAFYGRAAAGGDWYSGDPLAQPAPAVAAPRARLPRSRAGLPAQPAASLLALDAPVPTSARRTCSSGRSGKALSTDATRYRVLVYLAAFRMDELGVRGFR